jgi:hypothetical protein
MKKTMIQERPDIIFPAYPTCRVCRFYLSDYCEPCLMENNQTRFEMRRDLTLDDMPPFPTVAFNDGMPVRMRQAVVGAYIEKIMERLQGLR